MSSTQTVTGRVLDDGGRPVPGILAVVWDVDVVRSETLREYKDLVAEQGVVAAILRAMEERPLDEYAAPTRLGSAITGPDGGFRIEGRPGAAAEGEQVDERPDVVVALFAPDRPQGGPAGLPLGERLLYGSRPITFESGDHEAVIVRLDGEALARHGISPGAAPATAATAEAEARMHYTRENDLSAAAFGAFRDLKGPLHGRRDAYLGTLLPGVMRPLGPAPNFLPTLTPDQALKRIHGGLVQFFTWASPLTGRVYLDDGDLKALGLDPAKLASGEQVEFGRLLSYLGYPGGLVRNRDLLSQIEVRRRFAEFAAAPAPGEEPAGAAKKPETTPAALRSAILARLGEMVEGLAREPGQSDPAADFGRIRAAVAALEQTGIGANTAMHDVDILQVAFEPVWTAAFDARVEAEVGRLYDETVNPVGVSLFDGMQTDLSKVRDLASLQSVVASIGALGGRTMEGPAPELEGEPQQEAVIDIDGMAQQARRLETLLAQRFTFQHFTPGSINYGILQTYRQSWSPVAYQVGRVVDTIALAASETREVRLTTEVKRRSRTSGRELAASTRTSESSSTLRAEVEAVEKTAAAMTAKQEATGTFNVGVGKIGGTTTFSLDQSVESQRVHKSFAEIATKASMEVRREQELQVEVEITTSSTAESTRILKNPNEEMTVTYVLYELERRFRVASRLQAVSPVLLVALDMPKPHHIDESWLLRHAWILRDVLLEPDYEAALDLLENSRAGDLAALTVIANHHAAARAVLDKADLEFERLAALAADQRDVVAGNRLEAARVEDEKPSIAVKAAGAVFSGGLNLVSGGSDEERKAKVEAAQRTLEYIEKQVVAAAEARGRAHDSLAEVSRRYEEALTAKATADAQITQLRLHVRDHIFHYLHEIWRRRDPDDLFFSLYDLEVPFLDATKDHCRLRKARPEEIEAQVPGAVIGGELYIVEIHPLTEVPEADDLPRRKLVEIADLDRPLGFKGNYVIFPLRENSILTDFMSVSFLDGYFGIRDPSLNGSYSAADLLAYAASVWSDPVVGLDDDDRAKLQELAMDAALKNPGYDTEVVLPTGKVWMEALTGGQALLEPFKLAHRAMDVLKVEEEVRLGRLEALRRAQRIGQEKPSLGDPDIETLTVEAGPGTVL